MKKIPSLFVRDYEKVITSFDPTHGSLDAGGTYSFGGRASIKKGRFLSTPEITPGCEWVINGEGIATRKWDGTAVMIKDGVLYKRYDAKHGKKPPDGFMPCQEPDKITGHWPGWIQCFNSDPSNRYIFDAFTNTFPFDEDVPCDGTYEAIGPNIGGNPEKADRHFMYKHGEDPVFTIERIHRSFESIGDFLHTLNIEGIVYHHFDGRMCKVKRSDFGLKWPL